MGFGNIAEQLATKGINLELKRGTAKSVRELILNQGKKFEANSLEHTIMSQGRKFEQNESKYVKNVLDNVTEEPDLSIFRNSKGPNAFYDDAMKKQKTINNEKMWNQRAADMGQTLKVSKADPDLDYQISKLRANKTRNNVAATDTKLGNALSYLNGRSSENIADTMRTGRVNFMNEFNNTIPKEHFGPKIPDHGPVNIKDPEVLRKMYAENNDQLKNQIKSTKKEEQKQTQGKMDSFLKQAIPIAVGGGLIFSMFGRGGQMSNSELYGQQKAYGQ
jgi:hypothetical protein